MTCESSSALLADLVDGRLAPALEDEVEDHLEGCGSCRAQYAEHVALWVLAGTGAGTTSAGGGAHLGGGGLRRGLMILAAALALFAIWTATRGADEPLRTLGAAHPAFVARSAPDVTVFWRGSGAEAQRLVGPMPASGELLVLAPEGTLFGVQGGRVVQLALNDSVWRWPSLNTDEDAVLYAVAPSDRDLDVSLLLAADPKASLEAVGFHVARVTLLGGR